jgi:hypothetical protein
MSQLSKLIDALFRGEQALTAIKKLRDRDDEE